MQVEDLPQGVIRDLVDLASPRATALTTAGPPVTWAIVAGELAGPEDRDVFGVSPDSSTISTSPDLTTKNLKSRSPSSKSFPRPRSDPASSAGTGPGWPAAPRRAWGRRPRPRRAGSCRDLRLGDDPDRACLLGATLQRRELARRGPRGNAASIRDSSASVSRRSPAPAFSAACSGLEALGIAKSEGRRTRNRSATWRGVAPCAAAISCSTRPPSVSGPGKSPVAERAVGDHGDAVRLAPGEHRVLDGALLQVVEDLVAGEAALAGDRRGPPRGRARRSCSRPRRGSSPRSRSSSKAAKVSSSGYSPRQCRR